MAEQETKYGDVEIPENIFVRCPLTAEKTGFKQWKLRQARRCDGCEHFRGLSQRMHQEGRQIAFEAEFAVRCGYPMDRELFSIEVDR